MKRRKYQFRKNIEGCEYECVCVYVRRLWEEELLEVEVIGVKWPSLVAAH